LQNGKGRTYLVWCAWRRRRSCGWLVHWLGNASFFRSVLLRFLSWSWFLFSLGSLSKILDLFSSCSVFIFFSVCPSSSSQFVLPDSPSSSVYFFLCSFPARRPSVQGAAQPETRLVLVRWLANASLCFCLVCFSSRPLVFFCVLPPLVFVFFLFCRFCFWRLVLKKDEADGDVEVWFSLNFFFMPPPSFSWPSLAYVKPGNGFCSCIRASRSWGTFISVFLRRNGGASVL
jgi:hypothetical protein